MDEEERISAVMTVFTLLLEGAKNKYNRLNSHTAERNISTYVNRLAKSR
jgi:hypothetical protein